jgi:phage terminase large subunit-like protein
MPVFRLPRKLAWLRTDTAAGWRLKRYERMIVAAEPIPPRRMACIAVDSPHRMYLCGRALIPTHNTRTGAEWVRHLAETGQARRIALVAPTAADVRQVVVEGHSGLLAVSPSWSRPRYEPSKGRLTWPSGAQATMYSADQPDRLRGPQHDAAYCDELACWRRPEAWSNLRFGLRLGANPRICVTTTPKPISLVKDLIADPTTVLVKGSTHENRPNLAPAFLGQILATYEGTRLGQQEIYAEILEIGEGAWFTGFDVAKHIAAAAEYDGRFPVHLAIDAGTSQTTAAVWFQIRPRSQETGVPSCGIVLPPGFPHRIMVFGEYTARGLYSASNAAAIRRKSDELPCRGRVDFVRIDPAAAARTGIGPAAYAEYERAFGARALARAPYHKVADALDFIELLLDSGCLLIHPRCVALKAAFQQYVRARRGGEWLNEPAPDQSPHEDLIDALRYGIRDRFPEGRIEQPQLKQVRFSYM